MKNIKNGLHKTSKGMREMNYQDIQQIERATMPKLPTETFIGFMRCYGLGDSLKKII